MRVLQVTHQYPPEYVGGVEIVTQALARGLAARGHDAHVLTRAAVSAAQTTTEGGVTVHRVPQASSPTKRFFFTLRDPSAKAAFEQVWKETKPDIFHIQHLMGWPASLVPLIQMSGIPCVLTLHDYWFACANAQLITNYDDTVCEYPAPSKCAMCAAARAGMGYLIVPFVAPVMAYRNQTLKDALAEISCVITPSEFVKSMFEWQGYKTANWQVVPLGLDGQPAPRPAYDGPPRFAFIGGLAHQKGAHVLIEAFNAMPPDWSLTIAGDEDAFPEYTHGLWVQAHHEGIEFVGKLNRPEVWRLLSETDVLVVPSLWHETASLIAREAIAAGCVLVASDMGALREVPQGSRKSFFFPVGDVAALGKTLHDAAAEAGKPAALGTYRTRDDYTEDMLGVYESVMALNRR